MLDEPTNDLDLETLELLEEIVLEFTGTLLVVSHDREFLDNVTTATLALTGDGSVVETVGGYDDWARVSRAAKQAEAREKKEKKPADGTPRPAADDGRARRLSWKENQELTALPPRIEALEAEQAAIHGRLADPVLYRDAGGEVPELQRRLAAVGTELEGLYARWEDLEARRE